MASKRLTRVRERAMLGGICAGIADRYDLDVTLVRIGFVLLAVATGGAGAVFYIAAWLLMPAPEQVSMGPGDIARANVDDVVETAKQRAADLRHVNVDELRESARKVAHEVNRAANVAAEAARSAISREPSNGGATATPTATDASGEREAAAGPSAPPWTPPEPRPRAQHGGFRPPQSGPPPSGPGLPRRDR